MGRINCVGDRGGRLLFRTVTTDTWQAHLRGVALVPNYTVHVMRSGLAVVLCSLLFQKEMRVKNVCRVFAAIFLLSAFHPSFSIWAQTTTQGAGAATTQNQFVTPGHIIKKVDPVYPKEAKVKGMQGTVVLTATIGTDGTTKNIKVESGDPILSRAAIDAVSQWRYEPYRLDGVAADVATKISVNFVLGQGVLANPSQPPQAPYSVYPTPVKILPPPPEGVMRISSGIMAGQLEKKVDPVYPVDSIAVDARGDVLLLVTIKKTGEVSDVQTVSGPYRFRDAAINAVKQWHYRPYEVDGAAADVQTTITLNFVPPQTIGTAH